MKLYLCVEVLIASSLVLSCGGSHAPDYPATDSQKSPGSQDSANSLSYKGSILPIFINRCGKCHAPGGPLPNWQDYNTVFAKKDKIYNRVVVDRSMPPKDQSTITDDERQIIGKWIMTGAPESAKGTTVADPQPTPAQPPVQPPTTTPPTPTGLPDYSSVKATIATCVGCHDHDGNSTYPSFPKIAGLQLGYLQTTLKAIRAKTRHDSDATTFMYAQVQNLDDKTIDLVAQYFSSQAPVAGKPNNSAPGKALFENGISAQGVTACAVCHGMDASGSSLAPRIAGQTKDYILKQIKAFQVGDRAEAQMMPAIVKNLSDADASTIAEYLSTL